MGKSFSYDPLKAIPSAAAVRKRLVEIEEQARRLNILLRTAEELEGDQAEAEHEVTARRKSVPTPQRITAR